MSEDGKVPKRKTKKYKLKTYKAAAKRFRITGGGKLMQTKGGKSHLRRRSSKRTKQQFDKMQPVKGAGSRRRIKRLLPYIKKYKANPPA